jgi:HEAT repeat protein
VNADAHTEEEKAMKGSGILSLVGAVLVAAAVAALAGVIWKGNDRLATSVELQAGRSQEIIGEVTGARAETLKKLGEIETERLKSETALKKQVESLQAELAQVRNDLAAEIARNKKPINSSVTDAQDSALKISILTNPAIRRQIAPVMGMLGGGKMERRLVDMALTDADPATRSAALSALAAMDSREMTKVAVRMLESNNASTRQLAASKLAEKPSAEAKPAMLAALKRLSGSKEYTDNYTRRHIYTFMAKVGTDKDFDALVAAFKLEKGSYRAYALMSLLKIKGDSYETMLKLLEGNTDPNVLDYSLIRKLGAKADYRATEVLMPALKSSRSSYTRREVYKVLAKTRDPLAAAELVRLYKTETYSTNKQALQQMFKNGYPGITYDATANTARLIPAAELKQLLEARKKKVAALWKGEAEDDGQRF